MMESVGSKMRWTSGTLAAFWLLLALAPLFRFCCHDLLAAGHDPATLHQVQVEHHHGVPHGGRSGSPGPGRLCDHDGFQPGQLHAVPVSQTGGDAEPALLPVPSAPVLPASTGREVAPRRQGAPPGDGPPLYLRTQRLRI